MMDKEETRVALYLRTAVGGQLDTNQQENELQQYAAAQGYTNLRTYSDIGFSGLDMNRPAFMQMEQDIRDGMIDKIIIRDLSRIGRNYAQVMRWLDGLADIGVVLHTKLPEYADVAATMPIKRKGQLNPTTTPHKNKYPGYRER